MYQAMGKIAGIETLLSEIPFTLLETYVGAVPEPTEADYQKIPALPDDARYPVPVEISGW